VKKKKKKKKVVAVASKMPFRVKTTAPASEAARAAAEAAAMGELAAAFDVRKVLAQEMAAETQ
jgi:hypothetical protein